MNDKSRSVPENSDRRHPDREGYLTDNRPQAEATKRAKLLDCRTPHQQVAEAIKAIRKQFERLSKEGSTETEAEHIELVTTIYSIGRNLDDCDQRVTTLLAKRIGAKPRRNLFALLIEAALPDVPKDIQKIWAGAAAYADGAQIRPEKLDGFIWIKGGLVKCGETSPADRRREIADWKRTRKPGVEPRHRRI